MIIERQRVELIALRSQIEVLKGNIESFDKESRELQQKLASEARTVSARSALVEQGADLIL